MFMVLILTLLPPVGKIGVGEGVKMAAVDKFAITIQGKGGHGAAPQEAVDPIVIGSDIVSALQKIVSRRVSPLESAVVTGCLPVR